MKEMRLTSGPRCSLPSPSEGISRLQRFEQTVHHSGLIVFYKERERKKKKKKKRERKRER